MEKRVVSQQRVARWVREHRTAAGLTQSELALAAGVTQRYVSDVETSKVHVTLERASRIAVALGREVRLD